MTTLNLNSFNEILMSAMPKEKHKELLIIELSTAYKMKVCEMETLVQMFNDYHFTNRPPLKPWTDLRKQVEKINNINANCDKIGKMLEALEDGQ